jgi:hypothetical protein
MQGDWWYNDVGTNCLAGVDGDPINPPILQDDLIVSFLSTIQAARDSFERIVPCMLPAEQVRLRYLASCSAYNLAPDPKDVEDQFQHVLNTGGVRTAGPRGGGSWAPPPMTEDHESG